MFSQLPPWLQKTQLPQWMQDDPPPKKSPFSKLLPLWMQSAMIGLNEDSYSDSHPKAKGNPLSTVLDIPHAVVQEAKHALKDPSSLVGTGDLRGAMVGAVARRAGKSAAGGRLRAALRFHVPGEPKPREFTGPAHPFARLDAEAELGDLLDDKFQPRFREESGFVDESGKWYTRQEALKHAKKTGQLGGNPKALENVKRSKQLKAEALKQQGDAYADAVDTPTFSLQGLLGKDANEEVWRVGERLLRNEPMPRVSAVDAEKAAHMAKVYEGLPKNDPAAKAAYDALNTEVAEQMRAIQDAGYKIEYVDKDPYTNSAEMMKDVRENKTLKVFRTPRPQKPAEKITSAALRLYDGRVVTGVNHYQAWADDLTRRGLDPEVESYGDDVVDIGFLTSKDRFLEKEAAARFARKTGQVADPKKLRASGDVLDAENLRVDPRPKGSGEQPDFHPYMTPEQNDAFRAVHDWIAHAGPGNQFGPIGEENAFRMHAATLSPEAQRALATETRGQNSWVNFGPNAHLPVKERPFAEQKAALWPEELLGDYSAMKLPEPEKIAGAAFELGRNPKTGGYFTGPTHGAAAEKAEAVGLDVNDLGETGFVTSHGRFVGRKEASRIAKLEKANLFAHDLGPAGVPPTAPEAPAAPAAAGFGLGGHIPKQESLEYFRGPRTDPTALEEAYEMSRKAFGAKGPYSKYLKEGSKFPGAASWYDTRGIYRDAADVLGEAGGAERVNNLFGIYMPASTARSAPPNNLKRAFLWQQLAEEGLIDPEMLLANKLVLPPGFGHFAQTSAHQPALARALKGGKIDPAKNPKPASFGANLTGNMKPGTFDTVMGRIMRAINPKSKEFFSGEGPVNWAYQPLERGLADAADDAAQRGLLDVEPGISPTAAYQSLGWHGATKSAEYGSMYDIWNAMRDKSAEMWGVSPAKANEMIWGEGRVPLLPTGTPLKVKANPRKPKKK